MLIRGGLPRQLGYGGANLCARGSHCIGGIVGSVGSPSCLVGGGDAGAERVVEGTVRLHGCGRSCLRVWSSITGASRICGGEVGFSFRPLQLVVRVQSLSRLLVGWCVVV